MEGTRYLPWLQLFSKFDNLKNKQLGVKPVKQSLRTLTEAWGAL